MRRNDSWISIRDIDLFKYLHTVKAATYNQIVRDLGLYKYKNTLYKRLAVLKERGYIDINCHRELGVKRYMNITPRAFSDYVCNQDTIRNELCSKSPLHDIDLVNIRSRFVGSKDVKFYHTENELQSFGEFKRESETTDIVALRSDAAVGLNGDEGTIYLPIEYEATSKSSGRYEDLFFRYYSCDTVAAVLYICDKEYLMEKLKGIEKKKYPNVKPKFFYATLDSIMTGNYLVFESHSGEKIQFHASKQGFRIGEERGKVSNSNFELNTSV